MIIDNKQGFRKKELAIGKNSFTLRLQEDGGIYRSILYSEGDFSLEESVDKRERHRLKGNYDGFYLDKVSLLNSCDPYYFEELSKQIILHPRNREFLQFMNKIMNENFNGLKEHIFQFFPLYQELLDREEVLDPMIDEWMKIVALGPCTIESDFKSKKKSQNGNNVV